MDFKHSGELGGATAGGYFSCTWVKIISTPWYPGLLWTCENLFRKSHSVMCKAQSCSRWGPGIRAPQKGETYSCWSSSTQTTWEGPLLTRCCQEWRSTLAQPEANHLAFVLYVGRWEREMSQLDGEVWGSGIKNSGSRNYLKGTVVSVVTVGKWLHRKAGWWLWNLALLGVWRLWILPGQFSWHKLAFPTFTLICISPQRWEGGPCVEVILSIWLPPSGTDVLSPSAIEDTGMRWPQESARPPAAPGVPGVQCQGADRGKQARPGETCVSIPQEIKFQRNHTELEWLTEPLLASWSLGQGSEGQRYKQETLRWAPS